MSSHRTKYYFDDFKVYAFGIHCIFVYNEVVEMCKERAV